MNLYKTKQSGFIKYIVIFVVLVAIITYFNIDLEAFIQSKPFQWGLELFKGLWQNYVSPAIDFLFGYFERS